jgi:hypothetical protein
LISKKRVSGEVRRVMQCATRYYSPNSRPGSKRGSDIGNTLRTNLISGLILDGILCAYTVVSGLASIIRIWEAAQATATGLGAVLAMGAESLMLGIVTG